MELRTPDGNTIVASDTFEDVSDGFTLEEMDLSLETLSGEHQLWITATSP